MLVMICGTADETVAQSVPTGLPIDDQGTDVVGAFADSLKLLLIEHGIRIAFQEKTRQELGGPFWKDYRRSVRIPSQWEDTDGWLVNYLGHPIHGAAAGYIWLDHDPRAPARFGLNKPYWATRGRAAAWSGIYSLQFEVGPLSEASIGNVGLRPETSGWVDHVITPTGALGLMVAEDAIDRYIVEWIEGRVGNRIVRAILRMALNPGRTMANVAQTRTPWFREDRTLRWR